VAVLYYFTDNQPGPALDMIERFLKGDSFHDRPLVALVAKVRERNSKPKTQHNEQHSTNKNSDKKLLVESINGGNTFVPGIKADSMPLTATLLLTVSAAFLMGFVIARFTGRDNSMMQFGLGSSKRSGYGSIETYSE